MSEPTSERAGNLLLIPQFRLKKDIEEYELLMAPLTYPRYISEEAQRLMDGLMERKLDNRLGCLMDGTMSIKKVSERSERALRCLVILRKTSIRATTKLTLFHSIRFRTFFARRSTFFLEGWIGMQC